MVQLPRKDKTIEGGVEMALVRREHFEFPELWRRFLEPDGEAGWLRVEEFVEDHNLVIRTEMPGIDPDKDVELTISDGVLHLRATREEKSEQREKDSYRSEFRYGSFTRNVALPSGVKVEDVKASYDDGILEVRVPVPEAKEAVTRVAVMRG
jgi:HSP20 family protein